MSYSTWEKIKRSAEVVRGVVPAIKGAIVGATALNATIEYKGKAKVQKALVAASVAIPVVEKVTAKVIHGGSE